MFEFKFPDVGEGVHEGKILQIKVPAGETIETGDILAIVETDKVVAEIPAPKSGVVTKYGFAEGQIIEVGQILAYISTNSSDLPTAETQTESITEEENANVVGQLEVGNNIILPSSGEGLHDGSADANPLLNNRRKVLATPLARKLARDNNIDIQALSGTGPGGRITKKDITTIIDQHKNTKNKKQKDLFQTSSEKTKHVSSVLKTHEGSTKIELTTLRKTIAANMVKSSSIPTATMHEECNINELVQYRKKINEGRKERITYLPFFIKALSLTLKKFPLFNSTFTPETNEIELFNSINIGIAVDTDDGLVVPVIKNVENKNILEIQTELKSLAEKAKHKTLSLDEMRGGTTTISNYGVSGGLFANPLILSPQVCILGIGRLSERPSVINSALAPAWILPLSFVIDHRVLDGAPAGRFISYLRTLLESPLNQLILMS